MAKDEHQQRERFLQHLTQCEAILRSFVAGALPSAEERADFFQEVVLILWRSFDRFDAERPFPAWAMGVAMRRMKEEYRRRARLPGLLSPDALAQLADALAARALPSASCHEAEALEECLRGLPLNAAQLIRRRYDDDTSIETISAETGQSVAGVYKTLSRIRLGLADCIRKRMAIKTTPLSLTVYDR